MCYSYPRLLAAGPGVLPIKAYKRRLHPKGVFFSDFRYIKGHGFYKIKYMKRLGNLSFKGPLIKILRTDATYVFESSNLLGTA